ncbi:hypothetical protein [aff. Roholtiella sp. LEGE 12411]|uniref:hypothetical protein n=1 Tax=aff. Roholtiella sp. LEGE 12411 TaxID=1828822 RepID=UPI0018800615|nr:hypothetical protein [aff. Roholtiella sp. LEGE 12411]MBE9037251.1 hypothetical protein [aff. Roholtiella sp. LEGE 12411]
MLEFIAAESAVSFTIVLRRRRKPAYQPEELAAPLGVENPPSVFDRIRSFDSHKPTIKLFCVLGYCLAYGIRFYNLTNHRGVVKLR